MSVESVIFIGGIAAIFVGLLLSLTAIGVFTNEARGVSKSLAVMDAFTTAPASMQQELDPSFQDRVLTPAVDRFVGIGKRLTPADYAERIKGKLDVAGNPPGWTVDRVISLKFIGFVVALGIALLACMLLGMSSSRMLIVCVAAALIGYNSPNLYLHQKGSDRSTSLRNALPDALDLLTISVEAGLAFDAALSQVARNTKGPLADEFARVLQEMQIGLGRSNALRALGERTTLPDLRSFVSAMVQADAFGIPIGQVLRVQSAEIRVKRRQRAEEMAQKVPVKILLPLMFCILPCLFIVVMGPAVIQAMDNFAGV
ncbi:MAG: Type II/IV secretion system protein TadC, associated with Flp pilus assembly [uncultured Nocardioidaceae bacterium]|uniref:Type II/IV secretion system protein TadC, associated with Flp pilus assembly n=1 Tax=uncultured Nocardioidaceae bacterium TaxID=253824 RepID=A0A6J4LFP8_9ACTN|nr:MAG: Type II/IV secretion system protein TadC, associated with Flp pilus assembly [uncultured Nocardioidaceae bacterium]